MNKMHYNHVLLKFIIEFLFSILIFKIRILFVKNSILSNIEFKYISKTYFNLKLTYNQYNQLITFDMYTISI